MDDTTDLPTREQVFAALDASGDFELAYRLLSRRFPRMERGFFQQALLAYKKRSPDRWVPAGGRKTTYSAPRGPRRRSRPLSG